MTTNLLVLLRLLYASARTDTYGQGMFEHGCDGKHPNIATGVASAPCNTVIGPSRADVIEPSHIGRRRGLALQAKGGQCRGTRPVYKVAALRHVDFLSSPLQLIIKSEGKVAL
jgi:hypothetical protein